MNIDTKVLLLLVIAVGFSPTSKANNELETTILQQAENTEPTSERIPADLRADIERRKADGRKGLADARSTANMSAVNIYEQMRDKGFAIVDDTALSVLDNAIVGEREVLDAKEVRNFAYSPIEINDTLLSTDDLVKRADMLEDDGYVHGVSYAFNTPEFGVVTFDELSYSTIPNTTIRITKPPASIYVNGFPGWYTVLTNEEGNRGISTLTWITDSKLLTLTIGQRILQSSDKFSRVIAVANSIR